MFNNDITLTSILGVLTIPANKDRYLEIKKRPCYGLSFCSDEGCIVYNKGGKIFTSTKNTAIILPMGQSYSLRNEEGGNFPIVNFLCETPFTEEFIEIKLKNPEIYLKESGALFWKEYTLTDGTNTYYRYRPDAKYWEGVTAN